MSTSILILVVDDEKSIQTLLDDVLTDGGYSVRSATSGEEAMSILDDMDLDFKALITDVNLGSGTLTGWDVARHARETRKDIPVLYMTGDSAEDWSVNGVPKSVLVTKPLAVAQVVTAVSQLITEKTSADQSE